MIRPRFSVVQRRTSKESMFPLSICAKVCVERLLPLQFPLRRRTHAKVSSWFLFWIPPGLRALGVAPLRRLDINLGDRSASCLPGGGADKRHSVRRPRSSRESDDEPGP